MANADARDLSRYQASAQQSMQFQQPQTRTYDTNLPELPAPPSPPGAAFAAALMSGQLSPKPLTEREIRLRIGNIDLPAQGSLSLTDRLV